MGADEKQNASTPAEVCVDIDGNVYKTVKIGNQLWTAENLKVTRYRNGDEIPEEMDGDEWLELETGIRCAYNNDENNADTYGYLYNWYAAVDERNIAPEGWRVPTEEDWKQLEMALGMSRWEADASEYRGSPVGSKLAGNADLWESGDLKNHSEFGTSGFSALPAGYRDYGGELCCLGSITFFWSASKCHAYGAWYRCLLCNESDVHRESANVRSGFSVRLIRD